jgi:hypothetical protein
MGTGQGQQDGREGQLVAWAVAEARRLRLLGLRVPRSLIDGNAAIATTGPAMTTEDVAEGPDTAG